MHSPGPDLATLSPLASSKREVEWACLGRAAVRVHPDAIADAA